MDNWIHTHTIKIRVWVATILGLLAALYLTQLATEQPISITIIVVGAALFFFFWFLPDDIYWLLCFTSLFFSGGFNFLPKDVKPYEILAMLGLMRYLVHHVIFRGRGIVVGPRLDLIFLLGFMSVLFYHAVKDRLGMKVLGSSIWGGRLYVGVIIAFFVYFVVQTLVTNPRIWKWLPLMILGPALFDLVVAMLTYFVPSTIYIIYPFYSAITTAGIEGMDETERLGALGNFGLPLVATLLAYTSLKKMWHPHKWWAAFVMLAGIALCIGGGFRSAVLNCALVLSAASLRDFKKLAWLPVTLFAGTLLMLAILHSQELVRLPRQAQRALVFIPGKWNWNNDMIESAKGSDEFRFYMWDTWSEQYFVKEPLLGRGFGYPGYLIKQIEETTNAYVKDDKAIRESLLITQELHNGFISSLDCIGIIGTSFLITWCGILLGRIVQVLLRRDQDKQNPALRWVSLYLVMWTTSYWVGSMKLGGFLPLELTLAAVFHLLLRKHLQNVAEARQAKAATVAALRPAR